MKITKMSCGKGSCGTEKGNYTPGPAKGHLDTQMFPESKGTKYDRDVVRKTVERRKKSTKTAVKVKKLVGLESFLSSGTKTNTSQWDKAYALARNIYARMRDEMGNVPDSQFWNETELKTSLMQEIMSQQIDQDTADLAAETVISNNARFRKQPQQPQQSIPPTTTPTTPAPSAEYHRESDGVVASNKGNVKTAQQDDEVDAAIRGLEQAFGVDQEPARKLPGRDAPSQSKLSVMVIYPAHKSAPAPHNQKKSFFVPVDDEVIKSGNVNKILDYVWRQTNHVNGDEWISDKALRSSMVGDVFVVNGDPYIIASSGFVKVPQNKLDKWLNDHELVGVMKNADEIRRFLSASAFNLLNKTASSECKECNLQKEAQSGLGTPDIDQTTIEIGKIKSVNDAKKCVSRSLEDSLELDMK